MTFSLWNPISIVSVVNMLPKDSTCHHGHTGSELLNGHRWYYTLCTHADDLIPVRLRYFVLQYANVSTWFTAQSASLCFAFQDVTGAALFLPTSFFSPMGTGSSALQLKVHDPSEFRLGRGTFCGRVKLFAAVSHDS